MEEKIKLESLSQDSVTLTKQNYTTVNGVEYPLGNPWAKCYRNSPNGRNEMITNVNDPYKTAILAMWGETATLTDSVD